MPGLIPQRRLRALPWLTEGLARWSSVALGVALVLAGLILLVRPLAAFVVLGWYVGGSCLLSGFADVLIGAGLRRRLLGVLWALLGILLWFVLLDRVDLFAPLVAAALVGSGLIRIVGLRRDHSSDEWLMATIGLAELGLGVGALAWPDATLVLTAVLFGGRTALFGISLMMHALRRAPEQAAASGPGSATPHRLRRSVHWAGALALLLVAASTVAVSQKAHEQTPELDPFYARSRHWSGTPGELVVAERYDGHLPTGLRGYRMIYGTTDASGKPVLASAVLAVPVDATGPAPVIALGHGTVGVARGCAPSNGPNAITEGVMPDIDGLAAHGWAMVATDYPGLATAADFPYLIGAGEGHAVLDAARAARQVRNVSLSDQTVIWGHSQGGHAALWAGQLAPTYAPELHVAGVAALSPAADPLSLAENVLDHPGALGSSLAASFVVTAYTRYYPGLDADDVVTRPARLLVHEAATRCTTEVGTLVTVLAGLAVSRDIPIIRPDALQGAFRERLEENIPHGPWAMPVFIGQGTDDAVVPHRLTEAYVGGLRADGIDVTFTSYAGGTHTSVLARDSALTADLDAWTVQRLATTSSPDP